MYFCVPLNNAKKINSMAKRSDGDDPDGLLLLLLLTHCHAKNLVLFSTPTNLSYLTNSNSIRPF
jgi:hypothetical protein